MKQIQRIAILIAVFAFAGAARAGAGTIGPTCGTCQGSTYTLTNLGLAPTDLDSKDGTFDTWQIALTIDTSGYTGTGIQIDEVAIKIASSTNDAVLVSAPGGTADWTLVTGGLNANGCSGKGSGFDCADVVGNNLGAPVKTGTLLTWVFDIDISSALLTGLDAASIKVRYVDASGNKVGALVSEDITLSKPSPVGPLSPPSPVPEPGTLGLLALAGLAVAAGKLRLS